MNPIAGLSKTNLIVSVAGYGIALLFGWLLLNAWERAGELEAKLDNQVNETEEAVSANESNHVAIKALTERLRIMVRDRASDAERRAAELRKRDSDLAQARADAVLAKRQRDEMLSNECKTLSEIVVADVCPGTASGLRERSRSPGGY